MAAPLISGEGNINEAPLWTPDEERIKNSRLWAFMKQVSSQKGQEFLTYDQILNWSVANRESFWSALWDFCGVVGEKGQVILENPDQMPGAHFFPQAKLNYAENCLLRRDEAPAIIFRNETGKEVTYSFAELYNYVSRWQQAFRDAGIKKGDRVAGYLPNMPETIIAMLAATSIGAVWSSASPDFGVQGVVDRFGQIEPKILIAVDGYYYNGKHIDCLDKIREVQPRMPTVEKTVIVPFLNEKTIADMAGDTVIAGDFIASFKPEPITFERVEFNHPLFIMFSSGTTGTPKCIVHGHGGTLLQHLKELQLQSDIKKDDKVFYYTTCGWMMWNWLVTTLACQATVMLYDGSPFYPDGYALWDYTTKHQCKFFGAGAKYYDALKNQNMTPGKKYDLSALEVISSTGSPLVHETFDFIYEHIKSDVHVSSISGGTDIISCFVLGNPISPVWRGEIQGAGLGMAIEVFDDEGKPKGAGDGAGELVCTKAFPSMPVGFWNDPQDSKYRQAYFERYPNIWHHGDWIEKTIHNGYIIHGRSDATLNPGGVRIGTAEIYRQVEQIEEIMESLVVGQNWKGDVRIVLFVMLWPDYALDDELKNKIRKRIREGASPRHVPAKIIQVADIPRTKSNKITELAVRDIIHGRDIKNAEALANPAALDLYKDLADLQED